MAETVPQEARGRLGDLIASTAKWTGALVSLALIVGIVFWSYRLGVRDANDLPVIKAGDGPIRMQPDEPGGLTMANKGLEVNNVLAGAAAPEPVNTQTQLAPASESVEPGEDPVAAVETQPEPVVLSALTGEDQVSQLPQAAFDADGDLVTSPRPRPRPGTLDTSVAPTSEIDRMIAGTQAVSGAAGDGGRLVQLGAFASEEIAKAQWQKLSQDNADLLGGKQSVIQEAQSGGRTVYRLRVSGFDGLADSRALCTALKARSVRCILAEAQ